MTPHSDASEDGTGRGQPIVPVAMAIPHGTAVRRLMPVECERLQGLPDGHTLVPVAGKPAADGPRYKQIGNGGAVPHAAWVCQRLTAHLDELDARDKTTPELEDILWVWATAP